MWTRPIVLELQCIVCDKTLQKLKHEPRPPRPASSASSMAASRRVRTPNWSANEKQYLLELIRERREVVVPKNSNGPNHSEEKSVAWNEIMGKLTAQFGTKFAGSTIKKVKTQWQNMKRIAREELAERVISKQSMEVCNILEGLEAVTPALRADGPPPEQTFNVTIKQEPVDYAMEAEDGPTDDLERDDTTVATAHEAFHRQAEPPQQAAVPTDSPESPNSSEFDRALEADDDFDNNIDTRVKEVPPTGSSTSGFTEPSPPRSACAARLASCEESAFSAQEKKLKLETLKEEQQVVRAMRETAELNKIIAEQRLKQVLWMKQREHLMYSGEPGSGAGKGGGGGGSIRSAGGAFGKMEAGREEEYFYRKQKEQISELKNHLHEEITHHEAEIKRHQEAIRRHKQRVETIEETTK